MEVKYQSDKKFKFPKINLKFVPCIIVNISRFIIRWFYFFFGIAMMIYFYKIPSVAGMSAGFIISSFAMLSHMIVNDDARSDKTDRDYFIASVKSFVFFSAPIVLILSTTIPDIKISNLIEIHSNPKFNDTRAEIILKNNQIKEKPIIVVSPPADDYYLIKENPKRVKFYIKHNCEITFGRYIAMKITGTNKSQIFNNPEKCENSYQIVLSIKGYGDKVVESTLPEKYSKSILHYNQI